MPLTDEIMGTNADGSRNGDYCIYCYKDGRFTQDCTMEQMIDHCAKFTDEINKSTGMNLTPEQAKEQMRGFFPQSETMERGERKATHRKSDLPARRMRSRDFSHNKRRRISASGSYFQVPDVRLQRNLDVDRSRL